MLCAACAAMPDGNLVVPSKAHENTSTSNQKHQIRLIPTSIVFGAQIRSSRGQNLNIGYELVVLNQMQPHKIGLSDFGSRDSQSQVRYTSSIQCL